MVTSRRTLRAIRRINNNAALCTDGAGRELVALGRGIGFGDLPRDVPMADVQRTFYGVDARYLPLVEELPADVLEFSAQLADVARAQVSHELSPNLPITLADHIAFAIKRFERGMQVAMPLAYDVQLNYPVEYRLGELAVAGINKTFRVHLSDKEAAGIALSIVNSAVVSSTDAAREDNLVERVVDKATAIAEKGLGVSIDRDSFDYARFATHVRYLAERVSAGKPFDEANSTLYATLTQSYPQVASCAEQIAVLVSERLDGQVTDEEKAYLTLHVYRLGVRAGALKDE